MGNYHDDEFRDKPSWRDRDRKKDRSRHVGNDDIGSGGGSRWMRKGVLREAEKLFAGGGGKKKLNPEQEKAQNEIHRFVGSKKFSAAVKRYIKEYGLPEDWSTLMLLLDHKETKAVIEAMGRLKVLYPDQGLEEQKGFRSKLNIISMTTKDDELRFCAEEITEEVQSL